MNMKNIAFNDIEEMACAIADELSMKDDCTDIAVVAMYGEARSLITELIRLGFLPEEIELLSEDANGYMSEYIITVFADTIYCEPMLHDDGYLSDSSDVIYVMDNCSSKVIPYCKGGKVYEVSLFLDSEEENDDIFGDVDDWFFKADKCTCDKCAAKNDLKDIKAKSEKDAKEIKPVKESEKSKDITYKVNGEEVSEKEFDKKFAEFEDRYLDNVRDMLLSYCNLMDDVNEWRSRFLRW